MKWILILCLAMAGGCFKTINTVERGDRRIETDPDLKGIAVILGVRESVVSGDLTRVQVELYNNHASEERFNYKFEWFDKSGMAVDSPLSVWKPVTIQGKEQIELVGISPNAQAKDFRLKLQESKH